VTAAALTSALVAVCVSAFAAGGAGAQELGRVERIVDGDTVVVTDVGAVRLIGVDTPESVHPRQPVQRFAKEAATFLRNLALGQRVRFEYDQERRDRYGRTLAYLYLEDGRFVNAEIIRQGFGFAYTKYPFRYLDEFRALEREARDARRGLWADPPPPKE
jgi:micrococcal nuclease